MGFRLGRKERIDAGVRRVVRERLGGAAAALEGVLGAASTQALADGQAVDADEAVHCVRKQVKKARAVLRLVRGVVGEAVFERENRGLRELGIALGDARDAAVVVETWDSISPASTQASLSALREELVRRREAAHLEVGDADDRRRLRRLLKALAAARGRVERWPVDGLDRLALDDGVTRLYRKGRKAMKAAAEEGTAEAYHAWRKAVKNLWYALRVVEPIAERRTGKVIRRLERLAELLGEHHDLAVMRERVERIASTQASVGDPREEAAVRALMVEIGRRMGGIEAAAREVGERVFAAKPKRFARRVGVGSRARAVAKN